MTFYCPEKRKLHVNLWQHIVWCKATAILWVHWTLSSSFLWVCVSDSGSLHTIARRAQGSKCWLLAGLDLITATAGRTDEWRRRRPDRPDSISSTVYTYLWQGLLDFSCCQSTPGPRADGHFRLLFSRGRKWHDWFLWQTESNSTVQDGEKNQRIWMTILVSVGRKNSICQVVSWSTEKVFLWKIVTVACSFANLIARMDISMREKEEFFLFTSHITI